MKELLNKCLESGDETIDFSEYERLAQAGETNLVERKSIRDLEDVKANNQNIKEILGKAISAFANYGGGFLLWGCTDDGEIEPGVDDTYGNRSLKEWLEDAIWTSTTPGVKEFSVKKCKTPEGKHLYVVAIGESFIAPHQASHGKAKNKYFSRIDGKSKPIDGIIVRDIFNRQVSAEVRPEIQFLATAHSSGAVTTSELEIVLKNESLVPAEKLKIILLVDKPLINGSGSLNDGHWGPDSGQFQVDLVYPMMDHHILGPNRLKFKDFQTAIINVILVAKNMLKHQWVFTVIKSHDQFTITPIGPLKTTPTRTH